MARRCRSRIRTGSSARLLQDVNAAVAGFELNQRAAGAERTIQVVLVEFAAHADLKIAGDAAVADIGANPSGRLGAGQTQRDGSVAGVSANRDGGVGWQSDFDIAVGAAGADGI